jgi:hypothetical protein
LSMDLICHLSPKGRISATMRLNCDQIVRNDFGFFPNCLYKYLDQFAYFEVVGVEVQELQNFSLGQVGLVLFGDGKIRVTHHLFG